MVPSSTQIHANLVAMMGPGGAAGRDARRVARQRMIAELERLLPSYGIPPGGHRLANGDIDRRSVYAGPTTPTLYHKLERAFHTDGPPPTTERGMEHYQRGLRQAETVYEDLHFLTVVVSREHHSGLVAHGDRMVPNTFSYGGLDHLGAEMSRMTFLPRSITRRWIDLGTLRGCEPNGRCHQIRPASIPAGDELVAYAAELRLRYSDFLQRLEDEFGAERAATLTAGIGTAERRAWTQLAFARANGADYRPQAGEQMFSRAYAGLRTILDAAHHYETTEGTPFTLRAIFDEQRFARMASVRIARARAVEAELLDRYGLLTMGLVAPQPSATGAQSTAGAM